MNLDLTKKINYSNTNLFGDDKKIINKKLKKKHSSTDNKKVKLPNDFDASTYVNLYLDLKGFTKKEAEWHYINHGYYENRIYKINLPEDFDANIYIKLYPDLHEFTKKEAEWHYINHGYYENRIYKLNLSEIFDEKLYLSINTDLKMYNSKILSNPSDISMVLNQPKIDYSDRFIHFEHIKQNIPRLKHNTLEKLSMNLLHLLNKFILVVDFQNCGGGTSVFIESIISNYKTFQTFLIVRNFDNVIYFTVNDEYELETTYENENDAFLFLLQNKEKIDKIFINHILKHSEYFLNKLFLLGKNITTITHDFSILFNEAQIYFNEIDYYINNYETNKSILNINKLDQIITQNVANLYIFNHFIEDKNKIIVSPLPDFLNSKERINTTNKIIVIGVIGCIHEYKGKEELKKIIHFYKNNNNVKIIVFGCVHIDDFENNNPYNNIDELNNLLINYKPNIIIETSIWPETYSYTLTISMLTQLPIVYLKKNGYSVIENRLANYEKAYPFTNLLELNQLINTKKQDFFFTIEPIIYFNSFWDSYFSTSLPNKIENNNVIGDNYITPTKKKNETKL